MGFNTWVFAISLVYIAVALIHIYKTGYFFAGFTYYSRLNKEQGQYLYAVKENHGAPVASINNSVKQFDDVFCEMQTVNTNAIIADIMNSQPHVFLDSYSGNIPKEHNVTYDTNSGKFVLKTWGIIEDDTLFFTFIRRKFAKTNS